MECEKPTQKEDSDSIVLSFNELLTKKYNT